MVLLPFVLNGTKPRQTAMNHTRRGIQLRVYYAVYLIVTFYVSPPRLSCEVRR